MTSIRQYTADEIVGMRTLVSLRGDDGGPLKFGQSIDFTLENAQDASAAGDEPMCFWCGWGWFCHSGWKCPENHDKERCGYIQWRHRGLKA